MRATIPLGSVALAMGRAGLSIFPVWPGQKRPATKNGLHAASSSPVHIRRWWGKIPHANIGVACHPSRLVVVDCDAGKPWPLDGPQPDGVCDGADVLQLLAEQHADPGLLFRGVTALTPSGGMHLYFRAPEGVAVQCSVRRLGPWLDVRAVGGYVVAPFSSTPAGHYRPVLGWEAVVSADADGDFQPVANPSMDRILLDPPPLPDWLLDLLVESVEPERSEGPFDRLLRALDATAISDSGAWAASALTKECQAVAAAVEGTRNDTLNRAAFSIGTIVGAGLLGEHETTSALLTAAATCGLPESEAVLCIRSGMRAGTANPRDITGVP